MKKKLIIILAVLLTIGFLGYTSLSGASTNNVIDLSWELKSTEIKEIVLVGAEQDVHVEVEETENDVTKVELSGKVSDSTEKYLENTIKKNDQLEITLSKIEKLRMMVTSDGKVELNLKIYLGKDVTFNELSINSLMGDVKVIVPESFDGNYAVKSDGGTVKEIPETGNTLNSMVKVDTMGDISIKK